MRIALPDILAYLKSWAVISPNPNEAERATLFEGLVDQLHAAKLKTIREILSAHEGSHRHQSVARR
jgi:hypothetical protein